jgi:alpha-glucuronidase
VSRWFLRESKIADGRGRVDRYPGRVEAESMSLAGYVVKTVTPWETASGTGAVECTTGTCTAGFTYTDAAGARDIVVQYFDVNTGAARFRLRVGEKIVGEWAAADRFPTRKLDGSSSTRYVATAVTLKPGDRLQVEGTQNAGETAALDYVEVRAPMAEQRR